MNTDIKKEYINGISPDFKEIVEILTRIIESTDEKLNCEIKWNRLTYGLSDDYHHWICGIAQTKKAINLIFHFGGILDDENKHLIAGESFFLRKLEYKTIDDVDEEAIKGFINQAINKLDYFKNNWKELNRSSKH